MDGLGQVAGRCSECNILEYLWMVRGRKLNKSETPVFKSEGMGKAECKALNEVYRRDNDAQTQCTHWLTGILKY
eukprot:1392513-Amorphochlora_amoeboformis.AAC.3